MIKRVWEYKNDFIEGFTNKYGVKRLAWYGQHVSMLEAITREKPIRRWHRDWKVNLIQSLNPD